MSNDVSLVESKNWDKIAVVTFLPSHYYNNIISMGQVFINGCWESPPPSVDIQEWLNEKIAVEVDSLLCITRYIPRFELIRAMRKSSRSKPVPITVVRNLK